MQNIRSRSGLIVLIALACLASVTLFYLHARASSYPDPRTSNAIVASTTAYALSAGSSTRVLATSTTPGSRIAVAIQPVNCGTNAVVYLGFNDTAAAAATGLAAYATTTMTLGDTVPMMSGAIRAIAANSACTLLVTEFRTAL